MDHARGGGKDPRRAADQRSAAYQERGESDSASRWRRLRIRDEANLAVREEQGGGRDYTRRRRRDAGWVLRGSRRAEGVQGQGIEGRFARERTLGLHE